MSSTAAADAATEMEEDTPPLCGPQKTQVAEAAAETEEYTPPPCDSQTQARWYQLEALERALAGNTLVFLETGAGKTLIAVLLLRRYAHRIRSAPPPCFAVFLVPTVVLVTQQARVIQAHTDLRVAEFYGEKGVDFWDADTWLDKIDGAEVLVMTPQILLDNLRHSKFRLRDIPLLIFDECHHATGNSPYACIFKEFYHRQLNSGPSDPIPRIFGMTASLVNSKDLARDKYPVKISELENLMNAKVYTVDSESALLQYIPFATTRIVKYDDYIVRPELHSHTIRCLNKLEAKHLEMLKRKLHGSSLENAEKRIQKLNAMFLYCISELGVWLTAKAAEVLQSNKESYVSFWGEKLDEKVEGLIRNYIGDVNNDLSEIILKMTKRGYIGEDFDADLQDGLLTSKVYVLIKSLLEYRHMQDLRCIVFVKRIITSIVLEALLSTINQMSGWSVRYMAGKNFCLHQSRNKHVEIVDLFRSGKVHLIIATQMLEEGLDVPSCNVIIRFDQATTVRSFIQSRGRARMQNSDYVLLVRRGDADALSKTEKFLASGQIMREESQRLESTCCQPLPNTLCDDEFYVVESTGAIVTLNSSIRLIYSFCSKLPSDEYFIPLPRFNINKTLGTCTLHLPMSSPVRTVYAEGEVSIIKRIVCLNACRELHAVGALTDRLLPVLSVPCEDEPDIVVDKFKEEQPDYFPEQLMDNWLSFCCHGLYYCYKISLEGSEMTSPAEIVLAVKGNMGSDFISNSFKLWGVQDYLSFTIRYDGMIHLNQEQVIVARRFQTTILSLLINNDLLEVSNSIKNLLEMQVSTGAVYLLMPVVSGKIDWCSMKFSASEMLEDTNMNIRHSHSCKDTGLVQTKGGSFCPCMLQNSVVCTPHNGLFYAVSGFLDLNANSLLHRSDGSVLSYKTHFKERHGIDLKCEEQPLFNASRLVKVRNFLHNHECIYKKGKEGSRRNLFELPPELCIVVMTPVSANTLRCFTFVPSIMYRIQCMLLSMNLKMQLGPSMEQFDIPTFKILEALTAKKCNEEFSQESLETLGDSFLKYITTQHLFIKYRHQHEGTLTKMKKNLISNAALCELACSNNLVGYIRSEAFNPETWTIPGVAYDSCGRSLRKLKSKRIADSVEALIGAYLSAAGEQAAYLFLKALGMDLGFHKMPVERKITFPEEFINLRSLEQMLDYKFNDPSLLVEALTHGSYQIAGTTACYQRLEFLGDAVLDHIFTDYFYHEYPECTPELLTDLRSASVNNRCYAHAAVKAELHKHILHSSSALHKRMADYLDKFGQSFSGPSHGWEAGICLPKVLGDVIESIAGAIYIDAKHDKEEVWRSMKRLLEPLATPDTLEIDPVKELYEFCDPTTCSIKYTKTCENRVFLVVVEVQTKGTTYKATGTGLTKDDAKKLAAKSVLQDMKAGNRTQNFANGIS